ncbi:hypothetical protein Salat_0714700 [Sesamum alatum]|uniref:Uncharacterized protein n=1 Tax=Sesamum alatum TaxID=300844 RepID=A0AAE2CUZ8_9LAMI|nr:hypothetical protein Salat_0714700 [Sesamum alatum]
METTPQIQSDRARAIWRRCLASAFRTALACTIVGGVTLFGPEFITRQVAFPAFSYVTVILVVTDATLGDSLRGCWLALYATVQGVCPAILSLWLIGPARLTNSTTAAVVAISAFVVVLPENTHLISKRIALGQIVIVYVIAFINGAKTEPVMHPIHVAASTAVGVVACVLALLLPYPSLACLEVRENCKLYIENASERLKLLVKAFSAEDKTLPKALISQAKSLNNTGNKFLQRIKSKQESMQWEIIPGKFLKSYKKNPGETLQGLETTLRGMENAIETCSEFPVGILMNSELKNDLTNLQDKILNQVKSMALENSILPQSDIEKENKFFQTLQTNTISWKDLPSLFFIFCLKLILQPKSSAPTTTSPDTANSAKQAANGSQKKKEVFLSKIWGNSPININRRRLMPALRSSLSLGFAILFGLIYSKENGFWSGLPVAISLASAREATFKVANVKAQGTVLGTVYGVIGCFVFEKYVKIRFISLLPWFIFSSFLRQSRMYGQAGGISAVIGAVLILGRKNFGTPSDFAIARIVETFIGLSCSIMVDILLQPTRAAVLAKVQLSTTLQSLHESVSSITIGYSSRFILEERLKQLKSHVTELGKFIEEAEVEPNFWFLPFHSACYSKLKLSLSRMVDFLLFVSHALRFLEQESQKLDSKSWKEAADKLETDLKLMRDEVCSGIKCFEEVSLVKSLATVEREYEKRKGSIDLEMGKSAGKMMSVIQWSSSGSDDDHDEMIKKNRNSVVQDLNELVDVEKDGEEIIMKNEVILSLSAVVFCMDGMLKESKEIGKAIKELVQWENPSTQVDLNKLCFIDADETIVIREIGKLVQLQRLGITKLRREDGKELCSSLENLTNLRSLSIYAVEEGEVLDLQHSLPLSFLRTLALQGCLERLPPWIPSLNALTELYLAWSRLREDPLQYLEDLPNLLVLNLNRAYEGQELSFRAGGFQRLKSLVLGVLGELRRVSVEKGSMPRLHDLVMMGCRQMAEMPAGIEHLVNLQHVAFVDMAEEFVERMTEEKRVHGDQWKLTTL